MIKKIVINGLFGKKKVVIKLDKLKKESSRVKVLIGENGSGKTTILNIIYNALRGNVAELFNLNFDSISIELEDTKVTTLSIDKSKYMQSLQSFFTDNNKIVNEISETMIIDLITTLNKYNLRTFEDVMRYIRDSEDSYNHRSIARNTERERDYGEQERALGRLRRRMPLHIFEEFIKKLFSFMRPFSYVERMEDILYFPTYRRIEEDLENFKILFGNNKELQENNLINFGMQDVEILFVAKQKEVVSILAESFTELTANILTKLININQNKTTQKIEFELLKGALERLKDNIKDVDKNEILRLVATEEIEDKQYKPLKSTLINFIEQYKKQKEKEGHIQRFIDVCNRYLNTNRLLYDEKEIKIRLINNMQGTDIELKKLSSGEKQIISILSKIYLADENKKFTILFDEPELSLSIRRQETLLPDIMASGKVKTFLAVTHSPFIVENLYRENVVSLESIIS